MTERGYGFVQKLIKMENPCRKRGQGPKMKMILSEVSFQTHSGRLLAILGSSGEHCYKFDKTINWIGIRMTHCMHDHKPKTLYYIQSNHFCGKGCFIITEDPMVGPTQIIILYSINIKKRIITCSPILLKTLVIIMYVCHYTRDKTSDILNCAT